MRELDSSSWHALWPTLFGLLLAPLHEVGIRLLAMQAVQQHQRENRQIKPTSRCSSRPRRYRTGRRPPSATAGLVVSLRDHGRYRPGARRA